MTDETRVNQSTNSDLLMDPQPDIIDPPPSSGEPAESKIEIQNSKIALNLVPHTAITLFNKPKSRPPQAQMAAKQAHTSLNKVSQGSQKKTKKQGYQQAYIPS